MNTKDSKKIRGDWLDELHNSLGELRSIKSALLHKAEAFYATGNEYMCNFLMNEAEAIQEVHESINLAIGEKINQDMKTSQESSTNMLNVLLGVASKL